MRPFTRNAVAVAIVCLGGLLVSQARAVDYQLFYDVTFEDHTVGMPPNTSGVDPNVVETDLTTIELTAGTSVLVDNGTYPVGSGNYAVLTDNNSGGEVRINMYQDGLEPQSEGVISLSHDFYVDPDFADPNRWFITEYLYSGGYNNTLTFSHLQVSMVDGSVEFMYNPGEPGGSPVGTTQEVAYVGGQPLVLDLNTAHSLEGQMDMTNGLVSWYVDGQLLADSLGNTAFDVSDTTSAKNYVRGRIRTTTNSAEGILAVDNIRVERLPEPATMSLLAMGGLVALRRRRSA